MSKLILIGWDGATFDVIEPLVRGGRMPNLARLMTGGVWGRLHSTIPPLTPVAWTSISTGVNPGKHGIVDAYLYQPGNRTLNFVNASHRKVLPLWTLLSNHGKKVGVMNVPVTYPPEQVNGFIVSGMFTPPGVADAIYPLTLKMDIEKKFGRYRIECKRVNNPGKYLKNILKGEVEEKTDHSLYLLKKENPEFFFTVFLASDRVQHFFWEYRDMGHPEHLKYSNSIARVYESLDRSLGRLLQNIPVDSHVMMVSDHGAGPLKLAFYLNNWLIRKGYLRLLKDPAAAFSKSRTEKMITLAERGLLKIFPASVVNRIVKSSKGEREDLNAFLSIIDWEKTQVFSEGVAGGIFINEQVVKISERQELLGRIRSELLDVKDPGGSSVVNEVYRREEIYSGDHVELAPHLTVICNPGFQIIVPSEVAYYNKTFVDQLFVQHRWSGRHEQYGIFLLSGPGINKNMEITDCNVTDIAPTALYLMGSQVPRNMDGKVLQDAFERTWLREKPVEFTSSETRTVASGTELTEKEQKKIIKRMTDLGYM